MIDQGQERYRALIGRTLSDLAWLPLPSDTRDLVRQLDEGSFDFTGSVQLVFDDEVSLFATWRQYWAQCALEWSDQQSTWAPHSLDRVSASFEGAWGDIQLSRLERVDLFTAAHMEKELIVGVRHILSKEGHQRRFWIGSGGRDYVGEGDDLWVGVDCDPPNIRELVLIETITG